MSVPVSGLFVAILNLHENDAKKNLNLYENDAKKNYCSTNADDAPTNRAETKPSST